MCEIGQMYAMRPLIDHNGPLELPQCMYKMRNLHSGRNGEVINDTGHVVVSKGNLDTFERVYQFLKNIKPPSNMVEIAQRQDEILRQLNLLREQMVNLRTSLKCDDKGDLSVSSKKSNLKIGTYSAVININTTRPPYFLEILQKILQNVVILQITPHLHSSVNSWPNVIKNCLDRMEKISVSNQNNLPVISLRVIVKNIDTQTQLTVSDETIIGEVNVLRYLARTIPLLGYEDANPFEIDPILDACYFIVEAKTKSARAKYINFIFKKLVNKRTKDQWLCNEKNYTIADIAVYATFKYLDENELNVTLKKYMQFCKSTFDN
ncbi:probable aminoacyl tRNA synthase complex-interacting multifunctional protein 2 isoform X1 [Onthophagus taurus]|uniref:probable aminoacyl tRNA synthase complex-interacting multifunctional protein 2 isoform X1 n=1 Tax=Onthophagus taurus TaxID=166361 RepID=UPI0039BDE4AA